MEYPQRITTKGGPTSGENETDAGHGGAVVVLSSRRSDGNDGAQGG